MYQIGQLGESQIEDLKVPGLILDFGRECGSFFRSSVCVDLAWKPDGCPVGRECGLVDGEVPADLLGTPEVPLSKAPNS